MRQDLRALHLELFTLPSALMTLYKTIKNEVIEYFSMAELGCQEWGIPDWIALLDSLPMTLAEFRALIKNK
ncbi:MAG: hypothetical protein NTY64_06370 [Deltaproteobacteria bacterium]|nr:hypothetical protein [Deltaproteobacteria bacterium]